GRRVELLGGRAKRGVVGDAALCRRELALRLLDASDLLGGHRRRRCRSRRGRRRGRRRGCRRGRHGASGGRGLRGGQLGLGGGEVLFGLGHGLLRGDRSLSRRGRVLGRLLQVAAGGLDVTDGRRRLVEDVAVTVQRGDVAGAGVAELRT